jgi:uncharacterized protein (DUF427 family)
MGQPQRIEPGPGQESVWDYPRPPRVVESGKHVQVIFNSAVIAESCRAKRVLETAGAPVYYIPPEDVRMELLSPAEGPGSYCEWKGAARYFDVEVAGTRVARAAWSYPDPNPPYAAIRDHLGFYAGRIDACYVDDERVTPQPGGFYGGWITHEIVGPFKGEPGTEGW